MADLKGRTVSVGAPGSGTELLADRVLAAAGVDPRKDITRHSLGVTESAGALKDGTGLPVVITYHDTFAGTPDQPNSDRAKALCTLADAFIAAQVWQQQLSQFERYGVRRLSEVRRIARP